MYIFLLLAISISCRIKSTRNTNHIIYFESMLSQSTITANEFRLHCDALRYGPASPRTDRIHPDASYGWIVYSGCRNSSARISATENKKHKMYQQHRHPASTAAHCIGGVKKRGAKQTVWKITRSAWKRRRNVWLSLCGLWSRPCFGYVWSRSVLNGH